ncbi:MAG: hypothetical protein KDC92_09825 [Bacteroidetes bacterium]|nr:hypothetical protein [Bacteroidota bacterium]
MTTLQTNGDPGFLILVKHVIRWRKPILIITALAAISAVVFSMPYFMPPKFKSTITFYPTSTNSISKDLLAQDFGQKNDVLAVGEDEEAEQLLQILESDAITNQIIKKYNLMEHYDIDLDDPYKNTLLTRKYRENVNFSRNEHMAIDVEVFDVDPQLAADMANEIARLMDSVKTQIQRLRALDALHIVEGEFKHKEKMIQNIEDTLAALGRMGVINNVEQAQAITEAYDNARTAYYEAKAKGFTGAKLQAYSDRMADVKKDYETLAKYGGVWQSIKEGLILEREQYERLKEKYSQAKVDAEQSLPHKHVINYATPAEKKAKPVRSLLVVLSTFAAFVLSSLLFVLYESFKANKEWLLNS